NSMMSARISETGSMYHVSRKNRLSAFARAKAIAFPLALTFHGRLARGGGRRGLRPGFGVHGGAGERFALGITLGAGHDAHHRLDGALDHAVVRLAGGDVLYGYAGGG